MRSSWFYNLFFRWILKEKLWATIVPSLRPDLLLIRKVSDWTQRVIMLICAAACEFQAGSFVGAPSSSSFPPPRASETQEQLSNTQDSLPDT